MCHNMLVEVREQLFCLFVVCLVSWFGLVSFGIWVFETGVLCVTVLAVQELALQTRLASNSYRSTCLCLLSAGMMGMHHHYPA